MGNNRRFRLSDMIPNGWLYKLKDMSRNRKQEIITSPPTNTKSHYFYPSKCYYITRELIPTHTKTTNTKSSKQRFRKRHNRTSCRSFPKLVSSAGCSCRATLWIKDSASSSSSSSSSEPEITQELRSDCILTTESFDNMVSWSRSSCNCKLNPNDEANDTKFFVNKFQDLQISDQLQLPPIITKPVKFNDMVKDIKKKESEKKGTHDSVVPVKSVNPLAGFRVRVNSPKIVSRRRIQGHGRKSVSSSSSSRSRSSSLSDSFAVVKSSLDPQRDFRESMMEMIMENNIRTSKDLEDLLACYLSLNSDEYHHLIINVFKQIWFDLSDARFK